MGGEVKPFFTHTQITRQFGIKPHSLLYWTKRGYVTPSFGEAKGRGSSRFYSLADTVQIFILSNLADLGFNPESASAIARVVGKAGCRRPSFLLQCDQAGSDRY